MEYLALGFAGLLGSAYLLCSAAEFLLWLFEREPSQNRPSRKTQPLAHENGRLTAPATDRPRPITQPTAQAAKVQKPEILIVVDHRLYRKLLETWFRDHGFTVWAAVDGREAVSLYRAHANETSIALLDVHMPSFDGPSTFTALRQVGASIPCCFMTATLTPLREAHLLALGAAAVFEKPLLLREVTAVIQGYITDDGQLSGKRPSAPGTNRGDP